MTTFFPTVRMVAILATLSCLASCGRPSGSTSDLSKNAEADKSVTFVRGFYQEDALTPATTLIWAGQDAVMRVEAPSDGQYRVTFRPCTAFSMETNTIAVSVNDQPAGKISTAAFAAGDVVPASLEVALHAGGNDLVLRSDRPVVRLGENDERLASFGLLLPVTVEPVP